MKLLPTKYGRFSQAVAPLQRRPQQSLDRLALVLRFLLVAAVVGPALILAAFAVLTYEKAMNDAEDLVETSLGVLHEHTTKLIEIHQIMLEHLGNWLDGMNLALLPEAATDELKRELQRQSLVYAAWATDADGNVIASSLPSKGLNARGRDYFEEQKTADRGTFIGPPQTGRSSGQRIVTLSHRLRTDGAFAGVLATGMKTEPLEQFQQRLLPSKSHSAVLLREGGQVLARFPTNYGAPQLAPDRVAHLEKNAAERMAFWSISPIDNVERLWSFKKLEAFPLFVGFGLDKEAILGDWWKAFAFSTAAASAVSLTLLGAIWFASRRLKYERAAHAELKAETDERGRVEAALRQSQKMEAIGQLTGGLAHDLNNLLGVIIGNLDFLKDRMSADQSAAEALQESLEAALQGADLNQRLLAFARRQPLQPKQLEVNEVVAGSAKLLERLLGEDIDLKTLVRRTSRRRHR